MDWLDWVDDNANCKLQFAEDDLRVTFKTSIPWGLLVFKLVFPARHATWWPIWGLNHFQGRQHTSLPKNLVEQQLLVHLCVYKLLHLNVAIRQLLSGRIYLGMALDQKHLHLLVLKVSCSTCSALCSIHTCIVQNLHKAETTQEYKYISRIRVETFNVPPLLCRILAPKSSLSAERNYFSCCDMVYVPRLCKYCCCVCCNSCASASD